MSNSVKCAICGSEYDLNFVGECFDKGMFPITRSGRVITTYTEWLSDASILAQDCFSGNFFCVVCLKCRGDNYIQRT